MASIHTLNCISNVVEMLLQDTCEGQGAFTGLLYTQLVLMISIEQHFNSEDDYIGVFIFGHYILK